MDITGLQCNFIVIKIIQSCTQNICLNGAFSYNFVPGYKIKHTGIMALGSTCVLTIVGL